MTIESLSMKGMPFTPIDPSWLMESSAFLSDDPKLVRASTQLLWAAWRAEPAGSVPADMARLGAACNLTAIEVGEHYEALTEGWELRDGRLHHIKMSALCARIGDRFGDVIAKLAEQAAAVIQAPEEFELVGPDVEARTKGRRLIPPNFGLSPVREAWLEAKGFRTVEDRQFIMEKFISHAKRLNEKFNNWDAAFENFALKENMRLLPSNQNGATPVLPGNAPFRSRASRWGSAANGEAAQGHNASMLVSAAREAGR